MSHSLPRLLELHRAAKRLEADNALLHMQSAYAAFAAVMCKDGSKVFDKQQKALLKHINYE